MLLLQHGLCSCQYLSRIVGSQQLYNSTTSNQGWQWFLWEWTWWWSAWYSNPSITKLVIFSPKKYFDQVIYLTKFLHKQLHIHNTIYYSLPHSLDWLKGLVNHQLPLFIPVRCRIHNKHLSHYLVQWVTLHFPWSKAWITRRGMTTLVIQVYHRP